MSNNQNKPEVLKILQRIPGVGPSIANDLWDLGIRSLDDLKRSNPELLYRSLCTMRNAPIDRCVLYVFRCAVHCASADNFDSSIKWWHFKDL